jgi:hypothetical protein
MTTISSLITDAAEHEDVGKYMVDITAVYL